MGQVRDAVGTKVTEVEDVEVVGSEGGGGAGFFDGAWNEDGVKWEKL